MIVFIYLFDPTQSLPLIMIYSIYLSELVYYSCTDYANEIKWHHILSDKTPLIHFNWKLFFDSIIHILFVKEIARLNKYWWTDMLRKDSYTDRADRWKTLIVLFISSKASMCCTSFVWFRVVSFHFESIYAMVFMWDCCCNKNVPFYLFNCLRIGHPVVF